jgi:cytochrome P450
VPDSPRSSLPDARHDPERHDPDFALSAEDQPIASQLALYDELRVQFAGFHSEDRHGFWVLTRYDDIAAALRDPGTFSSRSAFVGNPDIRVARGSP